jgi:hypothetical protein
MAEDYESMTVAQLKEVLKEQDLPISGKKSELIARLVEANGSAEESSKQPLMFPLMKHQTTVGMTRTGTMNPKRFMSSSRSLSWTKP